jgi:7,8-dihydropterin-6-yl-methyl-4-(beta-D-ribofuranosyl)aminobenzene 5'-phosphate synthase
MSQNSGTMSRRGLLAGLAASGLGIAGGVFPRFRVANAQALTGSPPEIDRLSVLVLTDSYHHQLEPSAKVGDIQIQRYSRPPSKEDPKTLLNEWGLALHVETTRGTETRQIQVDFGFTPETLNHNMALLGVDPAKLVACN